MKKVPQYGKDDKWYDMDFETGEIFENLVPIDWLLKSYAKTNLYYSFNISNKHHHEHDFQAVLKYCFDYPETFSINSSDKQYYTKDQLDFLKKLQLQCQKDDLKDIMINNKFIISELEKRNYQTMIDNLKEDNN